MPTEGKAGISVAQHPVQPELELVAEDADEPEEDDEETLDVVSDDLEVADESDEDESPDEVRWLDEKAVEDERD